MFITLLIATFFWAGLVYATSPQREVDKKNKIAWHNKKLETKNEVTIENLRRTWSSRCNYLEKEQGKVNRLLSQAYRFNIIPNQYRNLASIYYIYDYMSSSQASLSDTLIHEHMEDGIQRILQRLDVIIDQHRDFLLQNRLMEINNQQRTNQIMSTLNKIEEYGRDTTNNTRIAANYAESSTYFSLANYLKK
jgi:hypothetical protein